MTASAEGVGQEDGGEVYGGVHGGEEREREEWEEQKEHQTRETSEARDCKRVGWLRLRGRYLHRHAKEGTTTPIKHITE